MDSGIIVSRGAEVRFWHLTFQEYLAARAVAGLSEADQLTLLFEEDRLYRPEWREVLLLLAGTLHVKQGRAKVDGLVRAVLGRMGERPSLARKAQCSGLLGAMLADLRALAYQPPDGRYQEVLNDVLGIFDARQAERIDILVRLEAAEALGQAGDPRLREANWVTIPARSFLMGAQKNYPDKPNYDPDAREHEGPVREVRLEAFQMGRYPVTVEEYRRFLEDDGYTNERFWKNGGFRTWTQPDQWEEQLLHPNRPVVYVSWYEAAAYCAWAGVRLPAEAEWECAALSGRGAVRYPWGNEEPSGLSVNYVFTPVGLYPERATPDGIQDMAGNCCEWVGDWYSESYEKPAEHRVIRGGGWYLDARYLRVSVRGGYEAVDRHGDLGFRCARNCLLKVSTYPHTHRRPPCRTTRRSLARSSRPVARRAFSLRESRFRLLPFADSRRRRC